MSKEIGTVDRARGALLGLAVGDSIGGAALTHRTIRLPSKRAHLWRQARELDAQHILRVPQPFTLGRPEPLALSGTDDTEYAVVIARILQESGADVSIGSLVTGWRRWLVDTDDEVWEGIAEASARVNLQKGLLPPDTGNDNPLHFDDSAIARAVPIGILFHQDPERAASVGALVASITNAEDGIWTASGIAAAIAHLVRGDDLAEALDAARARIPPDSWTYRCLNQADSELAAVDGNPFAAVPGWNDRVVNASYSYGNIAPETFAVAVSLLSSSPESLERGLGIAAMFPKQSDSLPGMVGAILGARFGARRIPSSWAESLDVLKGHVIPQTKGISISKTAEDLVRLSATASVTAEPK